MVELAGLSLAAGRWSFAKTLSETSGPTTNGKRLTTNY